MYGKEIFPNVESDEELDWRCKVEEAVSKLDRNLARNDVIVRYHLEAHEQGARLDERGIEVLLDGAARLSDDAAALRKLFCARRIRSAAPDTIPA